MLKEMNKTLLERQKSWLPAIRREEFTEIQMKNATVCAKNFIKGSQIKGFFEEFFN